MQDIMLPSVARTGSTSLPGCRSRAALAGRPAGLALVLGVLFATGGCASGPTALIHPRAEAAERAQDEPARASLAVPAAAEADQAPQAPATPVPAPPAVAAEPVAPASERHEPLAIPPIERAPPPPVATRGEDADGSPPDGSFAPAIIPPREPPPPPPAQTPRAPLAPATDRAVIVFTDTPGERCLGCETVKISVAPSGRVLIERSSWTREQKWRYKRSTANAGPERAAAFAAGLRDDRPAGSGTLPSSTACPDPAAQDGGLVIEWIEAGRDDQLTVRFDCALPRNNPLAERLRRAPDLLGLQLAFP
jgi:hypothetical protein